MLMQNTRSMALIVVCCESILNTYIFHLFKLTHRHEHGMLIHYCNALHKHQILHGVHRIIIPT